MTNLNNHFTTWATALRSGDTHYLMITRVEDSWYLLSGRREEPIISLEILIDGGFGIRHEFSYYVGEPDDNSFTCSIIVKNSDSPSLVTRDRNGFYGFGVTGEPAPADALLVYARTQDKCIAILANRRGCHVQSFDVAPIVGLSPALN